MSLDSWNNVSHQKLVRQPTARSWLVFDWTTNRKNGSYMTISRQLLHVDVPIHCTAIASSLPPSSNLNVILTDAVLCCPRCRELPDAVTPYAPTDLCNQLLHLFMSPDLPQNTLITLVDPDRLIVFVRLAKKKAWTVWCLLEGREARL